MSNAFRTFLKTIGSGVHTGKDLSRSESAAATRMMLTQEATPAQIGAFMIAHRIKRPTPEELVGMMDAYDEMGTKLAPISAQHRVTVFNSPYDGRSRTAPVTPLTALILAAAKCPVVMHGGDRIPTKYGLPLVEVWQLLGIDWTALSYAETQHVFEQTGLGFIYLPRDFPAAQALIPYRDQIGKRPPFATIEIMWAPYSGEAHVVSGFVHPPTEERTCVAYQTRGEAHYTTVKGLEGSGDLPRDRTAILGIGEHDSFERVLLVPRDYDLAGADVPLLEDAEFAQAMQVVLAGDVTELSQSAIWNGGFYLWRSGACDSVAAGIERARQLLTTGAVQQQLQELKSAIADLKSAVQV